MELNRGRLVDHIQIVTRDLTRSRRFYETVLGVLDIPIEGEGDGYFWADELVVSSTDSEAAMLIRRPVSEVFEAIIDPAITSHFWFCRRSDRLAVGRTVPRPRV